MTVPGTQPDSPREWLAVFPGALDRNCVVGSTAEHFPPAVIDGYRLKSANEATRVAIYGPVGGDGVETGAGSAAPGLAGVILPESDSESGQDDSGQLRAQSLAACVRAAINHWHVHFDPGDDEGESLDAHIANELLRHGFRRVSVDDDTVERVADAMARSATAPLDHLDAATRDFYRAMARAAVQALRDGGTA